jgi:hypothetical protein
MYEVTVSYYRSKDGSIEGLWTITTEKEELPKDFHYGYSLKEHKQWWKKLLV